MNTGNSIMDSTLLAMNAVMGGDMNQEKQTEDRREFENDRRETLIADRVLEIKDHDGEHIFKTYASDLASTLALYHDAPDFKERLVKELEACIEAEAKADLEHRLSGGE